MDLGGMWSAIEADDDIRRHGIDLVTDDSSWPLIEVPGHWQLHPKFATSNGPLMYRRRFDAPIPAPGRRRWVTFDGIFYQADVWLDGAYLGDPEGYFFPHSFDVTALSRLGEEHVLAVEVTCSPQPDPTNRRNITGVFQHGHGVDESWNPGGLWRSAHLYDTGPVRVDRFRVLCRDADSSRAHLRLAARLDSDQQRPVLVRTSVDGDVLDERDHVVATGRNEIEWSLDVADPALWWPRCLGDQPLSQVTIEVLVDDEVSDRRQRRTGFRQVEWNSWTCSVNGERLFLKGANVLPTSYAPATADDAAVRADVQAAIDLGLDAIRVNGHIADRSLYDAADEHGLLVLQDFPLIWGHVRSTRRQAVDQAAAAVAVLGHHPSIVQWNGHNDPADVTRGDPTKWKGRTRRVMAHQLPSWNKTILDRWVKRSFERADPSRDAVAHSGVLPHLPQLSGTDSHLWLGWDHGDARDLARLARRFPRIVRFVSAFGAHSVPSTAPFLDEQLRRHEWPNLDWSHLAAAHGYQLENFETLFPPEEFADVETWTQTTQRYQAHVLKVQIETLRRLKYRPAGGFCFSSLADPAPAFSTSLLDHARVPKHAHGVVAEACAPMIVVADQPPEWVSPGDRIELAVHIVNDLRQPFPFAVVDALASWAGGETRWRFGGPLDADSVVKAGVIDFEIPDSLGELSIALRMTVDDRVAVNRYSTAITLPIGS